MATLFGTIFLFTLIIEACLKLNMHFDSRYLERLYACVLKLFYILLNVRNGIECQYPSIVFLSILQTVLSRWPNDLKLINKLEFT